MAPARALVVFIASRYRKGTEYECAQILRRLKNTWYLKKALRSGPLGQKIIKKQEK